MFAFFLFIWNMDLSARSVHTKCMLISFYQVFQFYIRRTFLISIIQLSSCFQGNWKTSCLFTLFLEPAFKTCIHTKTPKTTNAFIKTFLRFLKFTFSFKFLSFKLFYKLTHIYWYYSYKNNNNNNYNKNNNNNNY